MKQSEKRDYLIQFRKLQQSRETKYGPRINRALYNQYKTFLFHYNSDTVSISAATIAVDKISSTEIKSILSELYLDAGTTYGASVRAHLNRQKGRMAIGFSERMFQLIKDYFQTDILNQAEAITKKTKEIIKGIFVKAYKNGEGINEVTDLLQQKGLSYERSRLIARTETVTAANKGAYFVAKDSKLKLRKEWLSANDDRTRKHHIFMDGQAVGRDDYFNVGGYEMMQPGDRGGKDGKPKVPPEEVCNCRCTVLFEPVRINGQLIRE